MTDRPAGTWPQGVDVVVLDAVDSTNAEGLRRAPTLDRPTWITARRQLSGRGRRGRPWTDPPGNLAATLVLRPGCGPAEAARFSFVAALAVHDALRSLCGPHPAVALKWPNDVLLNGGKLAGILLEGTGTGAVSGSGPGAAIRALAIGIGINLRAVPDTPALETGALRPVSLQGETGLAIDPDDMLAALAAAFADWQARLDQGGFAPIRGAWLARAARLGETVTARIGASHTTGRFEGIDATGALLLAGPHGRQAIAAADVFFAGG